jgi:hypothetical protein
MRRTVGLFVVLFVVLLPIYFLPAIIGIVRKKKNAIAIFVLDLFAGWTVVGWIGALVWACTKD